MRNTGNRGKGYSVRHGVLEARGEFILFTDADLSAPIEEADKLLAAMESSHADAVVGSRALATRADRRPPVRPSRMGRPILQSAGPHFLRASKSTTPSAASNSSGAQTTRRAFELQRVERFGFDPEILFLIERLGGKVVEIPVRWNHNPATKVHYLRDSLHMTLDLIVLRWRALTGQYEKSSQQQ